MVEIIQFLLVGAFSGFVAGLFGVGGGLILVPFLLFTLHGNVESDYLMHTAVGTSLGIIFFTSKSSVRAHHKHKAIDWGSFKKISPSIVFGSLLGAYITKFMSFDFMKVFFVIFELIVAAMMLLGIKGKEDVKNLSSFVWNGAGTTIGVVSAIVGIGGGTMTTPFLTYNNVKIKNAIATSAAVGMPIAIAGAIGFTVVGSLSMGVDNGLGFIHLKSLVIIVLASVTLAPLGAKVAHSLDSQKLKKLFAVFLILLAISVLLFDK